MAATMDKMKADMKAAMKSKEKEKLGTIRMLLSSLKNAEIDAGGELSEDDIIGVLSTEAKKRREAAQAYRDGDRDELADKEEAELAVVEEYLPKQLSDDEIAELVDEVIAQTGASTKADMGKVMGPMMGKVKGRADGSKVKDIVLSKLG
jgi:uncharacterized protein YqeY